MLLGILGVLLLLAAWQVVGATGIAGHALPPLTDVVTTFVERFALLMRATGATAARAAIGGAIGLVLGLILAAVTAWWPRSGRTVVRSAVIVNAVPIVAIGPVLMSLEARPYIPEIFAALSVLFSTVITASDGMRAAAASSRDLFQVFRASRSTRFRHLDLPSALPLLADALRLAVPAAVLGALLGEWFGADRGLGVVMVSSMRNIQYAQLWAAALIAVLVSLVAYALATALERAASARFSRTGDAPAEMAPLTRLAATVTGIAVPAAVVVLWQLWIAIGDVPLIVAPPPLDVAVALGADPGEYFAAAGLTLGLSAGGVAVGGLIGLLLAVAVSLAPWLSAMLSPLALVIPTVPIVVFIPIVGSFFGYGVRLVRAHGVLPHLCAGTDRTAGPPRRQRRPVHGVSDRTPAPPHLAGASGRGPLAPARPPPRRRQRHPHRDQRGVAHGPGRSRSPAEREARDARHGRILGSRRRRGHHGGARLCGRRTARARRRPAVAIVNRSLIALPKVHVHAHLDGSYPLAAVRALAKRSGDRFTVPEDYPTVWDFFDAYGTVPPLVGDLDDLRMLCRALVHAEAAAGVRYLEPAIEPQLYAPRLGDLAAVTSAIVDALQQAAAETGIEVGGNLTINTDQDEEIAVALAELAASFAGRGITALGTAGFVEPAGLSRFARAAGIARDAGLQVVAHAGQTGGPASIREALDEIGATRISHGVHAVDDPELVARLAEERIVLDVCPTSNVRLGISASLAQHPAPRLIAAGVPVTLNADDSLWFATSVVDQYQTARTVWGFDDAALADLARCGALIPGMSERTRSEYEVSLAAWFTAAPG